jgi:hypothetical protein
MNAENNKKPSLPLWKVSIEIEIMVVAENRQKAEAEALYHLTEERDNALSVYAEEIEDAQAIPMEWRQGIPYGDNRGDDRTCLERLKDL